VGVWRVAEAKCATAAEESRSMQRRDRCGRWQKREQSSVRRSGPAGDAVFAQSSCCTGQARPAAGLVPGAGRGCACSHQARTRCRQLPPGLGSCYRALRQHQVKAYLPHPRLCNVPATKCRPCPQLCIGWAREIKIFGTSAVPPPSAKWPICACVRNLRKMLRPSIWYRDLQSEELGPRSTEVDPSGQHGMPRPLGRSMCQVLAKRV
jgi:hypothetical protein